MSTNCRNAESGRTLSAVYEFSLRMQSNNGRYVGGKGGRILKKRQQEDH